MHVFNIARAKKLLQIHFDYAPKMFFAILGFSTPKHA